MSIDQSLKGFAMLGAQWVLWLLISLSVVAVAIVIERVVYLTVSADDYKKLRADLRALLSSGQVEKARRRLDSLTPRETEVLDKVVVR